MLLPCECDAVSGGDHGVGTSSLSVPTTDTVVILLLGRSHPGVRNFQFAPIELTITCKTLPGMRITGLCLVSANSGLVGGHGGREVGVREGGGRHFSPIVFYLNSHFIYENGLRAASALDRASPAPPPQW